ncbi:MAG: DUF4329 domain-containing protein [Pseudomonadales bacterium]
MGIRSLFYRVWSPRHRLGLVLVICLMGPLLPSVSLADFAAQSLQPTQRGTADGAVGPLHNETSKPASTLGHDIGSRAMLSLERFASERQAVEAAVNRFNPYSVREDREYLGAVVELRAPADEPAYRYLVARGRPGQDRVSIQLPIPKGAEIVAFWHTHGAHGPNRHLFSGSDTSLVRKTGKPFYMADAKGNLRVFRPGQRLLSAGLQHRLGLSAGRGYAEGELLVSAIDA